MLLDFLKGYYDIIIILIQSVTKLTDIVKQTSKYVEGNALEISEKTFDKLCTAQRSVISFNLGKMTSNV